MTETEKLVIQVIVSFNKKANELINLLAERFSLDLKSPGPFNKLLNRKTELWKGELEGDWTYRFHGDACSFENSITKQFLDVKINRDNDYGAINDFYLYQFMLTTKELKHVTIKVNSRDIFYSILEQLELNSLILKISEYPFEARVLNYKLLPFDGDR